MNAFRRPNPVARLLRVPGLVLGVVALFLLPQLFAGGRAATSVEKVLGRYSLPESKTFLAGLAEMLRANNLLLSSQVSTTLLVTLGTALAWLVLLAGVIRHLAAAGAGASSASHAGSAGGPTAGPAGRLAAGGTLLAWGWWGFPRILVVTLWHLLVRAVLVGLPLLLATKVFEGAADVVARVLALLVLFFCICALDLARCRAVLGAARPYRPGVALAGFAEAARRPRVLLPSMALSLAQWGCAVATLAVAIDSVAVDPTGSGSGGLLWAVRGLAALAVFFGLLRLSVAVGATTGPAALRHSGGRAPSP